MKIEYTKTNFLYLSEHYLASGVNCLGIMGAGVARALRAKYPEMYKKYEELCSLHENNPKELLGEIQIVPCKDKVIINCFTQLGLSRGEQVVDYDALRSCIREINSEIGQNGVSDLASVYDKIEDEGELVRVAFPKIGCGLAGGSWEVVSKIIEEESTNFQPVVSELVK